MRPDNLKIPRLVKKAKWLRGKVLDMALKAGAGHIAPSFSCAEILVALYYGGIIRKKPKTARWLGRDRFILSKGQAAVALYAVLADLGYFPVAELNLFTQPGSFLGGHTEDRIPGVEAFTGSLGHGLPIACGLSWAAKQDRKKLKVYVLLGDGECHEGSIWEAAMFAGHHRLNNMLAVIDHNGLSATDYLSSYLSIEPLNDKFESFGWDTVTVEGHSFEQLLEVMEMFKAGYFKKPLAVIAKTTKGKGVSYMESKPLWHYRIPAGQEVIQARKELRESK